LQDEVNVATYLGGIRSSSCIATGRSPIQSSSIPGCSALCLYIIAADRKKYWLELDTKPVSLPTLEGEQFKFFQLGNDNGTVCTQAVPHCYYKSDCDCTNYISKKWIISKRSTPVRVTTNEGLAVLFRKLRKRIEGMITYEFGEWLYVLNLTCCSFATRVPQLKIWHFLVMGTERTFADALLTGIVS